MSPNVTGVPEPAKKAKLEVDHQNSGESIANISLMLLLDILHE